MASRRIWQCRERHPRRQFSVKVGTIFEDSPLGLEKWLPAVWLLTSCKNGISSCELARGLGITQKSAWFMLHRLRLALQDGSGGKLGGELEVDETFVGGKARNMHVAQRKRRITGTGGKDKTLVMGSVERGGKVRATVVSNRNKEVLQAEVKKQVEAGAGLYSDELLSYEPMAMLRPPLLVACPSCAVVWPCTVAALRLLPLEMPDLHLTPVEYTFDPSTTPMRHK